MSVVDLERDDVETVPVPDAASGQDRTSRYRGVLTGSLVGLAEEGRTPLVTYAGQPGTAALPARTTVDLYGAHIGRDVILMFDEGDPCRPIVVGCVRGHAARTTDAAAAVEIETDGERVIVAAKEQLVLKCGKASITLTSSGKVLISGAYVLSHSTGTNRVKGGSVQLN